MRSAAVVLVALVFPISGWAQDWIKPIPLASPALSPGVLQGHVVGGAQLDTGRVVNLPRIPAGGAASWAIEIDTLDMRRKWTLRLRAHGRDGIEVVLRKADSLPPEPRTYDIKILATGISHADPKYLAGEMRFLFGGKPQRVVLGGGYDRATFGKTEGGTVTGAIAVVGGFRDNSDPRLGPLGQRRYRGLEAAFTARETGAPMRTPHVTAESEMRMMARALDGVFISWIGAMNRDGDIEERSPAGVRSFVTRRWGSAIAVDSVVVRGDDLWVQLRGKGAGSVCSQGTNEIRPICRRSETRSG